MSAEAEQPGDHSKTNKEWAQHYADRAGVGTSVTSEHQLSIAYGLLAVVDELEKLTTKPGEVSS